ncbi:glycosyltransferase [Flavobacterium sp. TR2]|uniref:glycosyltransferase family 2 protein n=1 Tax=Flavobacterium sp. TR2 TaxID=2977321 RepID=UPI0021B14B23|nr:glycosyltransferase [Flavobacterium sp. TR2]UWY28614.1 glycosyltransferase [Flavobacterium sp. TR2]
MHSDFKVSVCMITYGHEKYIRQAIEGVLMQECDFEVELIISNDCSPDMTDEVVQDIVKNYPKKSRIKYFKHEINLGIMPNLFFSLEQCTGKYVAMCEGDDYWITKDKLQKQVDILENNEDGGLVYSNAKHYIEKTGEYLEFPYKDIKNPNQIIPEMLKSKFIEFASTVFRKKILDTVLETLREELKGKVIGDTRILLETIYISKLYYLNEVSCVYRILDGSASHPMTIDKFIFTLQDSYFCRKSFVQRNNLNRAWLSDSICNTNRILINKAFVVNSCLDTIHLLKNILILDTFKYCKWNVFKKKMNLSIWIKFVLSLIGIGVLRQKLK